MKKVSVIVVAVFAVAFAGYAEAAKPKKRTRNQNRVGPYGAALLGNSVYPNDQGSAEQIALDVFDTATSPTRNISVKSEDSDIAYQLAFGYRFNRYLAAELSLAQYGEASSIARGEINPGTGFVPANVKLTFTTGGPMFSAIGILPINDKFEFYGRAGFLFASADRELVVRVNGRNTGFSRAKADSTEVVFGAGFAWHLNQVYSIRLEHQRLTDVGDDNRTGLEDINYTALGVTVRF